MKLGERIYQAVMQVNVLSSEIYDIVEADTVIIVEGKRKVDVKASQPLLYRSLRQQHDIRWCLLELGRSAALFRTRVH